MTRLGDLLDFGQVLKHLAAINLAKSPTFLDNFCKGVKIYLFSSEIIFGQLLLTCGDFYLVTPAIFYFRPVHHGFPTFALDHPKASATEHHLHHQQQQQQQHQQAQPDWWKNYIPDVHDNSNNNNNNNNRAHQEESRHVRSQL